MCSQNKENKENVVISKTRYDRLIKSEQILNALYAGGVDNWEWYDASLEAIEE